MARARGALRSFRVYMDEMQAARAIEDSRAAGFSVRRFVRCVKADGEYCDVVCVIVREKP